MRVVHQHAGLERPVELTPTTMANRSSVSCTSEPAGYTPIMRMKALSTVASKRLRPCAKSTDTASCGVSEMPRVCGLHRLS
jgi:hypothetical protein